MIAAELCQELDKVNCVSITVDGSKRKEQGRWRAGTLPLIRGTTGTKMRFHSVS